MAYVRPQLMGPGVYLQEVPSGVHTITGVATSVTVFFGRTNWGPVGVPTEITSIDDFNTQFGGLRLDSPMTYAVQDFFLNGGSTAIVVRLFKVPSSAGPNMGLTAATAPITKDGTSVFLKASDAQVAAAKAAVDAAKTASDAAQTALATAQRAATTAAQAVTQAQDAVTRATTDDARRTAQDALAAAQAKLDAANRDVTAKQQAADGAATDLAMKQRAQSVLNGDLGLVAASPGKWGTRLTYRTDLDGIMTADGVSAAVQARFKTLDWPADDLFNISISFDLGNGKKQQERFTNVSMNPASGGRQLWRVLDQFSALASLPPPGGTPAGKGLDSDPLDVSTYQAGLMLLEKIDVYNLVCIPPDQRGGDTDPQVYADAANRCFQEKATLILDPPSAWEGNPAKISAEQFVAQLGVSPGTDLARYTAVYYPRVIKPDPLLGNAPDTFTPSGMIAGVIARTDASQGVWVSAAGFSAGLVGLDELTFKITDKQSGDLNSIGVNCLRSFPATGPVIWGARTLKGSDQLSDDYKYLAVRRLADYIEQTLLRQTQWAVFAPNDETLWAQLRLAIGTFMSDLFRQGAFAGDSKDKAYFVKCDAETTLQSDIDLGIVNVRIGFAPLKPAEFVVLYLQQIAGQTQS